MLLSRFFRIEWFLGDVPSVRSSPVHSLLQFHFTSWCEQINSRARARPTASAAAAAMVRGGGAISGRERGEIASGGPSGERQLSEQPRCRAPPSRSAPPSRVTAPPSRVESPPNRVAVPSKSAAESRRAVPPHAEPPRCRAEPPRGFRWLRLVLRRPGRRLRHRHDQATHGRAPFTTADGTDEGEMASTRAISARSTAASTAAK